MFDITDSYNAPWHTLFNDANSANVKFVEHFRAMDGGRMLVHCTEACLRSPCAIRSILIKFFNFTPFQARTYLRAVYMTPFVFHIFPTMLDAELALCTRADKLNDFGLRVHPLAKSTAPEAQKRSEFAHRSAFKIRVYENPDLEQEKPDGREDVVFSEEEVKQLKRALTKSWLFGNYNLYPASERIIPFINFDGCLPDEVPVEECVLYEHSKAKVQYYRKT